MNKQYSGKKREVQYHFYNKVTNPSNVVALAGNNLDLHINDFKHITTKPSAVAYVYDINVEVVDRFKYLEKNNKVQIINDSILNCKIERFMDIDLMRTLDSIQGIIYYLFNEQFMKYNLSGYKKSGMYNTFMFTHCLRNNKRDINNFVHNMLKGKNFTDIQFETMTYKDGAPMCTTQIRWK